MKRGFQFGILLIVLGIVSTIVFLDLPSPTGMATLHPTATITGCDWVMNDSSSIQSVGIICGPGANYGIKINASDVVLNCTGDFMFGIPNGIIGSPTDAPAIVIENQDNVTIISNYCYLEDMGRGIKIINSTNITIQGLYTQMTFGAYSGWVPATIAINITDSVNITFDGGFISKYEKAMLWNNVNDSTIKGNFFIPRDNFNNQYNPDGGILISGNNNNISGNQLNFYRDLMTIQGGTGNIVKDNTLQSRYGTVFYLNGTAEQTLIQDNTISGDGGTPTGIEVESNNNTFFSNDVYLEVYVSGANHTTFTNENIYSSRTPFTILSGAKHTTVKDSTLFNTNAGSEEALSVTLSSKFNFTNCTFSTNTSVGTTILFFNVVSDGIIKDSIAEIRDRSQSGKGIVLQVSDNITFDNINVTASDDGAYFFSSYNITINNSKLVSGSGDGSIPSASIDLQNLKDFKTLAIEKLAIDFDTDSDNNTIENTEFYSSTDFIYSDALSTGNVFTDVVFNNFYGGIRNKETFILPANTMVDENLLSITLNKAFVNSTAAPFLNKSSRILLNYINQYFGNILVNFDDDGVFDTCAICTGISYDANTKRVEFNTTHFTTYSANGSIPVGACNTTILTNAVLGFNLTANGTNCINFGADNIELDCKGYWIIGDGTHYGVNISNRKNITLKNCNIKNFSINTFVLNTNNSLIQNNTMAVPQAHSMWLNGNNNDVFQNNIRKTGTPSAGASFRLAGGQGNNITGNTMKSIGSAFALEVTTGLAPISQGVIPNSTNNYLSYNAVGSTNGVGMFVNGSSSNTYENMTVVGNGTGPGVPSIGIWLADNVGLSPQYNIFRRCTGVGNPFFVGSGIYLLNAHYNEFYDSEASLSVTDMNNLMPSAGGLPNVIYIDTSSNNNFSNLTLDEGYQVFGTWLSTASLLGPGPSNGNNITGLTFTSVNGSVSYSHLMNVPTGLDIYDLAAFGPTRVIIRTNEIYVNSTGFAALNATADLSLRNLAYLGTPYATVNLTATAGGPNTFENCSNYPGLCSNFSYSLATQTASYTVSHFTSFSTNGTHALTCPMTITSDFNLTNDLTSSGTCITVNASNITIDCQGHKITGDGTGDGISMTGYFVPFPPFGIDIANVTIQNCHVDNFANNIHLNNLMASGGGNNFFINNQLTNATNAGIKFNATSGNNVSNNFIHSHARGIDASGIFGDVLTNNIIHSTTEGIYFEDSNFVNSTGNEIITPGNCIYDFSAMGRTGGHNFINNALETTAGSWASFAGMRFNDNFTNTTFRNSFGSVRIVPSILIGNASLKLTLFNILLNRTFVNSTALPFLNTTAEIQLDGLPFATTPTAVVDLNDNGVYTICTAPRCTNTAYAGGTFTMDVTGFTSYAVRGAAGPSPTPSRGGGGGSNSYSVIIPPQQEIQEEQQKQTAVKVEEPKINEDNEVRETKEQMIYERAPKQKGNTYATPQKQIPKKIEKKTDLTTPVLVVVLAGLFVALVLTLYLKHKK